ncbi:hypothetical protein RND71_042970 [Anisodus tanguticus]|uniref:Uncharacterized protein n=1 Tax=Anisodus tanguticus TaxID=243964 RepID=A0AAE1UNG3_9SOLA|nr:hypothetical protein RND71_042970 [Anisodus tanguticus]
MSVETRPVVTSLTRRTWNSELKPAVSSSISDAASIPELITYLKSAFREKEFSLVERILIDHKDQGLVDLEKKQLKDMERKCEELKNEKDEAEANLKAYMEKFKELEGRMLLLEEDAAKKRAVDVSVIQKLVEDLEAEEEDVVEVNCQGSGADEQQLSPRALVYSTGNGSGKSGDEGLMWSHGCRCRQWSISMFPTDKREDVVQKKQVKVSTSFSFAVLYLAWCMEMTKGLIAKMIKNSNLVNALMCPFRSAEKGLTTTVDRKEEIRTEILFIAALGEYLIDGDPENKLRKAVEEVRPKDHAECKRLATKYCYQLYQIYLSKEDPLFSLISKF